MNSPTIFQALAIKSALELYHKHKMRVNSSYTPRAMMRTAQNITGEVFKSRDYKGAAKALKKWIDEAKLQERIKSNG